MDGLEDFIQDEFKQAEKTVNVDYGNLVVMSVKLKNGYVIVEHCICMDPKEFDINIGIELCKEKIVKKLHEIYKPVSLKNSTNLKKLSIKAKK